MELIGVIQSIEKGIGETLGFLVLILGLGAMLGKLVAESGAAQRITSRLVSAFGVRFIQWAVVLTGFIVGIPMFYEVGFVILVPLVFTVVCALSFGLLHRFPARTHPFSASARWWIFVACALNGLQTLGMFICISLFRHANAATVINIVYNSRGIWSVLLVWLVGPWFGNIEREYGMRVMLTRLIGSMLLLSAIAITLLKI